MEREQLVELARELEVSEHYYKSPTKRLIWAIQEAQGREPCYLGDQRYTCKDNCEWDASCKKLTAAWLR